MIEFVHYIEIPIRVYAEHQPYEPAERHYPGCPETVGIADIEICLPDYKLETPVKDLAHLKDYILAEFDDEMRESAWEHKND